MSVLKCKNDDVGITVSEDTKEWTQIASSISFKVYNLVYMIFRAKISTADFSIWPPIQSAFLQETKIYYKFPETRTTAPLATSAETGQKLTPFQVGGTRPSPFWRNRGCRISILLFKHLQAKQHGLKHFVLCSWQLS